MKQINIRITIVVFHFVCICTPIFLATETHAENLMDVFNLAVLNDADYQAATIELAASNESIAQAKSQLLPDVAIRAERSKTKQDILRSESPAVPEEESDIYTSDLSITLTQPIYKHSSWVELKQSKIVNRQAEVEFKIAQQQLIVTVAEAYFDALAAQDNLLFAETEKTAVAKQLKDAKSRNKAGMGRVTDVYDAQSRYALTENRVIEAQNRLDDSFQVLQQISGIFISNVSPLKDKIIYADNIADDLQKWIDKAINLNLEIELGKLSVEMANLDIKRSKADHYPTLDLVASRNRQDTDGPEFGSSDGEVDNTFYLLRFNLPIYQGGRVQSHMRQGLLRKEKAFKELESQHRKTERDIRAAFNSVATGKQKIEAFKKSIESQEKALEIKEKGLKSGLITLLDVLDAQRDLYFAYREYSQARYQYLLSVLKLKMASGNLEKNDLEKMNAMLIP